MIASKPLLGSRINQLHPLSRCLIGVWLFNEGAGSKITDLSGNSNDGVLTNMTPSSDWIGSHEGGYLNFNGVGAYVNIGSSSIFDITSEDFTICISVTPDTLSLNDVDTYGDSFFLDKLTIDTAGWAIAHVSDAPAGRIGILTAQGGASQLTASAGGTLSVGQHSEIAVTRSGAVVRIYHNGVEVSYSAQVAHTDPVSTTQDLLVGRLGQASGRFYLDGKVGHVYIYKNRVFSPDEAFNFNSDPYAMFSPALSSTISKGM